MSLVSIFRYAQPVTRAASTSGTQFVEGELAFEGATTIPLAESIYTLPGLYVLFSYGTFPDPSQLSNITIDLSAGFSYVSGWTLENDSSNNRVLLLLKPIPDVGAQYVEGDLTFTVPTPITLDASIYQSVGEYILFDVTGTITGEAFVSVVPPAGLTATTVYKVGNQIKVTLY